MATPTTRIPPTKLSRSFKTTPIVLDLTNHSGIIDNSVHGLVSVEDKYGDLITAPPSPIRVITPGKQLRRKKDMTVKRFSAPPVSPIHPRPSSVASELPSLSPARPGSEASMDSPPLRTTSSGSCFPPAPAPIGLSRAQAHQRTQSQPTVPVKFGHPSRPYYTGIRPRPTSVIGLSPSFPLPQTQGTAHPSAVRSRPTSLAISTSETASVSSAPKRHSFLDVTIEDGDIVLPTPSALSPPVSSLGNGNAPNALPFGVFLPVGGTMMGGVGHSTSGETEMRMAAGDHSYTFTGPPSRSGSLHLKSRMKEWKRGVSGLMRSFKKH